jgi:hypothetical protein
MVAIEAVYGEKRRKVVQTLFGLCGSIAGAHELSVCVAGDLSGDEEFAADSIGVTVSGCLGESGGALPLIHD